MKTKITIEAPGSEGELTRDLTEEQQKFLLWHAVQWNLENQNHASPFLFIELDDHQSTN